MYSNVIQVLVLQHKATVRNQFTSCFCPIQWWTDLSMACGFLPSCFLWNLSKFIEFSYIFLQPQATFTRRDKFSARHKTLKFILIDAWQIAYILVIMGFTLPLMAIKFILTFMWILQYLRLWWWSTLRDNVVKVD